MNLIIDSMRDGYVELCNYVYDHGEETSPRGMTTREIRGAKFTLMNPYDSLPLGVGRGVSIPFAAAEAAQLIGGVSHPQLLLQINPTMERFMDWRLVWDPKDEIRILEQHGAYGPRVTSTMPKVLAKLKEDPNTRQAVATIFDPRKDYTETADVPCTLSLQFMIRHNLLELFVTMRSNDVWWGTAYDVFQFTQLQITTARMLGIDVGPYHHYANSMHTYQRDWDSIHKLHSATDNLSWTSLPHGFYSRDGFGGLTHRITSLISVALGKQRKDSLHDMSPSEQWYLEQLSYVSPRAGDKPVQTVRRVSRDNN